MEPGEDTKKIVREHPIYWFEDGSLILDVEVQRFKVHRTLLSRHSRYFAAVPRKQAAQSQSVVANEPSPGITIPRTQRVGTAEVDYVKLEPKQQVSATDVEALLQHLYHDVPLGKESPFIRVAAILRVSSPQQLDFPDLHVAARNIFEDIFPRDPNCFTHDHPLHDALQLATLFNISSVRKAILYSLVTTTEFDGPTAGDAETCMALMFRFIEHFTPILFTPAATPHMACTDVFADTWMTLVIQPALNDDGVYKPLETLERMKSIDWGNEGLCSSCVAEKREEWSEEQRNLWRLMDSWLGITHVMENVAV
ncbi:hypothetical protein B0H34DRAFT_781365 [Crassisporium funariophilum]|nr:hypothetical protein B0H34DRAFT_781365 [Crassisporium funariophilum]